MFDRKQQNSVKQSSFSKKINKVVKKKKKKNPPASTGDPVGMGWTSELERSPGGRNVNPLRYSCLAWINPWTEEPDGL